MTGPVNMNGFPINNVAVGNSPSSVATLAQGMPIGAVIDYALKTPPAGWQLCTAQPLLANTPYQTLRTLLISDGFPYGQDGSGNPRLPDARGCVIAGYDAMGGASPGRLTGAFGATVGSQTHQLTALELPSITPTFAGGQGLVTTTSTTAFIRAPSGLGSSQINSGSGGFVPTSSGGFSNETVQSTAFFTPAGSISTFGSNVPHNNVQPTLIMNKIIKVSYDV